MAAVISPVLHYADLEKAVEYLRDTFGFEEHVVHRAPDGAAVYAEIVLDGCYLGVGPTHGGGPFELGPTAIYAAVDDPDAIHDRAKAAGAEIVMPLVDQDYGSREFAARDHEGNVWCFGTFRPGSSPAG